LDILDLRPVGSFADSIGGLVVGWNCREFSELIEWDGFCLGSKEAGSRRRTS